MIDIRSLTKIFKSGGDVVRAVDAVDLQVREQEFFVLLGLSGSGKTTLLRCVAGLEKPELGEIKLGDETVSAPERGIFIPVEDRALGMVFQSYAVWPHMTVFQNVAFPLANGKRRLARALAVEPKVLLMDEPLSNLDARLREEVRDEIRFLATKLSITVLYVTHDQVEAMALADRIAVMSGGKILQIGAPQELYDGPRDRRVGEVLGSMNEFEGSVQSDGCVKLAVGVLDCALPDGAKDVIVAIRPEDVAVSRECSGASNEFAAELLSKTFLGDITVYNLSIGGTRLRGKTTQADGKLVPGSKAHVRLPADKLKIFPK